MTDKIVLRKVQVLSGYKYDMTARIYSADGLSPTITTHINYGGGGQIIHIEESTDEDNQQHRPGMAGRISR